MIIMRRTVLFLALISIATCAFAYEKYEKLEKLIPSDFTDAIKNGEPTLEFRLRHENARQNGLEDARATTLRSTVGYETAEFSNAAIKVELVDVANFFGQRYNPGVSDLSKPQYSLIQDPHGAGVTEAKFMYYGFTHNVITLGRQYINLDNQRFIGKNNFRQYPQSFDAFSFQSSMIDTLDLFYSYLTHINTNFANGRAIEGRRSVSTHLIHADWTGYRYGQLAGYIYFNKDRTIITNSHTTLGVRLTNPDAYYAMNQFGYSLELAQQKGKFGNPNKYTRYYVHATLSKTIEMFTGLIGLEKLGGSSSGANRQFITPLGSIDDFNGIAEVFNNIPNRGLQDYYAKISAATIEHDMSIGVIYHYFRLDRGPGSRRAGQEFDLVAEIGLNDQIRLSGAYAHYSPKNNVATRTRRIWIMITANLL